MYSSLAGSLVQAVVGLSCLAAGVALSGDAPPRTVNGLILTGAVLLVVTPRFHHFATRLTRAQQVLEHRWLLGAAAIELGERVDELRVAEIAVGTAADLAGGPVRTAAAVGPTERLEVAAATGPLRPAVGTGLRLEGDRLWPLPSSPSHRAVPALLDDAPQTALVLPMRARGTTYGVLLVDTGRPVEPALRGSLEALCRAAGLALATARLTAELSAMAFYDPLTRLPNRVLLGELADKALARAARDGTAVALLVLDLDGFKDINDRFGHRVGDEALVIVAARLLDQVRDTDVAARLGGDEFVVLLADLARTEHATAVAERIVEALCLPVDVGGTEVAVGVSAGVATWRGPSAPEAPPAGGPSMPGLGRLLQDADSAMYLAKSRGTGCEVFISAARPPASRPPDR
jgi:diguanylate cyclase (GGDEF)-like protein